MVDIYTTEKQQFIVPGDAEKTIQYICESFVSYAKSAVEKQGKLTIALSGGSTPKALFQAITKEPYAAEIPWEKLWIFWSDERAKPLTDPESNYHTAMALGNLQNMPIPKTQIFPMKVETLPEEHAKNYQLCIEKHLGDPLFDLVMLGVGEDGHTASLFPGESAVDEKHRLVVSYFVKAKNMWRMTLTLPCINRSQKAVFIALGKYKAPIVHTILEEKMCHLPAAKVGSSTKKALWIVDNEAAMLLSKDGK